MATIPTTNSQGTKVYICPAGTDVSTATAIQSAYATAKLVGCIQDLGSLTSSRNVTEYSCLSEDNVTKSFGSLTLGNLTIGMLYDGADTAGQSELKAMFDTNTTRVFIVGLSDGTFSGTTSPTCFTFNGGVSSFEVAIAKDSAVMATATVEIMSVITTVAKDATA
jgi:hypothetical protein